LSAVSLTDYFWLPQHLRSRFFLKSRGCSFNFGITM
jgi:hypothetical protein